MSDDQVRARWGSEPTVSEARRHMAMDVGLGGLAWAVLLAGLVCLLWLM